MFNASLLVGPFHLSLYLDFLLIRSCLERGDFIFLFFYHRFTLLVDLSDYQLRPARVFLFLIISAFKTTRTKETLSLSLSPIKKQLRFY